MKASVYYNEIDPFAAEWMRWLIKAGEIPDGVIDTRSIVDVQPEDIRDSAGSETPSTPPSPPSSSDSQCDGSTGSDDD